MHHSPSRIRSRGRLVATSLVLSLLAAMQSAGAATATWGGDTSNLWSNAANWDVSPAVTGDTPVFGGGGNLSNSNDHVTGVARITFGADAGSCFAGGNAITISGGGSITDNAAVTQTIGNALTNGGVTNVNATSGATSGAALRRRRR